MVPAQVTVFLSQKPSTEDGKFRVAVLIIAWTAATTTTLLTVERTQCHKLLSEYIYLHQNICTSRNRNYSVLLFCTTLVVYQPSTAPGA